MRSAFSPVLSANQGGPFNFFHSEQKATGKLVMTTMEGQYGVEPETISYQEFKKLLNSPHISESESLKETLEALRRVDDAESLPGCDRLAEAQNHLVDLFGYIEGKVGYSVFQLVESERPSWALTVCWDPRKPWRGGVTHAVLDLWYIHKLPSSRRTYGTR